METYVVGQEVVVRRNYGPRTTETATITKVGRRWATLRHEWERFDLATGLLDGRQFSSPGEVWPDMTSYEAAERLDAYLATVRRAIRDVHRLSDDQLVAIGAALNIHSPEEEV